MTKSFISEKILPRMARGFLTQRRKGAKAQRGQPQPKNLNRSKQRKQRRKNFAKNAQFSGIALQGASSDLAASRLGDFALKGLFNHPGSVHWMRLAALCLLRLFAAAFLSHIHSLISIATIPLPHLARASLKAEWRQGCCGSFAQDPFPYLDEAEKKQRMAAHSELLRKFTELAFDEAAEMRWQESQPAEADHIDVGSAT